MTGLQKPFRAPQSTFRSAADIASDARAEMGVLNESPGALGLRTGIPSFDAAASMALEPQRLMVVCGQSGGGKTGLLSQWGVAFASQVPTLLLTLEDGERDLVKRQLASMSRESISEIRRGFPGKDIPDSVDEALVELSKLDLHMSSDLYSLPTVLDIGQTVMAWRKQHCEGRHGVVIIDQLSHIADTPPDDPYFAERPDLPKPPNPALQHLVLEWKVNCLRRLAKSQGLTIVLAHQLNDSVSDTEKPTEKSVRSSRGVLHAADCCIAVWTPKVVDNPFGGQGEDKYIPNTEGDSLIISLKARTVEAFEVPVKWVGSQQRFAERLENEKTKWKAVPGPSEAELAGAEKLLKLRRRFEREADGRIATANAAAIEAQRPAIGPADEDYDVDSW